ncbi:hypothetical protein B9J07_28180 [Sinorhizobium sp. LM21]|uniref:hypothetical protein n=1 Tax=Sinorhizobium sp. LM21 TaxID=1449788 RepID=UPI000B5B50FA|nr:hypothetical protein [Sinorhizobium sp. LM21]OWZ90466.1 hypothetical protein B9J07_28180 [Sinorhizobium sp. LM21]
MGEEEAYDLPASDKDEFFDRPHLPGRMVFKNGKWQRASKLSFNCDQDPNPYADNPAFGAF